ncbi:MAG: tripartite tricarboxylate transporter substrate binding protein [Deltaproteobacteria bacterium]|nr:tripartite tricarboxylate transporter substrate binding protein [Deltaproteobacteria bacterium]
MKAFKLLAIFAVLVLTMGTAMAAADDYPSKPVKLIVPFPPGGSLDLQARLFASLSSPEFSQTFFISNVGGAGGAVGAAEVARSKKDGYTLLVSNVATGTYKPLSEKLPYNMSSFIPICQISASPAIFAVNGASPYKTLADLIAKAKAAPNTVKYSTAGVYSAGHVPTVQFAEKAKVSLLHIPYDGGNPAMAALLGNHVDLNVNFPGIFSSPIKGGQIRPLAVASSKRLKAFPELKTLKEQGIDVEAYHWISILAPAGTPDAVVAKLRQACKKIIAKAEFDKGMAKLSDESEYMDGPEFAAYWKKESAQIETLFKNTKMQ